MLCGKTTVKKPSTEEIQQEEKYVAFLKKRVESKNFKENVTKEEFDKTKLKYKKAKLKLRMMKGEV